MAMEVSYSLSTPLAGHPTFFPASRPYRRQQRPAQASLRASASSLSPTPSSVVDKSSTELVGGHDLLIVGPGVLGRIVAQKWRQDYPDCQIFGETFGTDHHDELLKLGINPYVKGRLLLAGMVMALFCLHQALQSMTTVTMVFVMSLSYMFSNFIAGLTNRIDVLLKAENVVLEAGGSVLRLAGLYKADRGAHNYWLGKGKVDLRLDHILNLIHYEDAASLSVAILKKKLRGHVLLGCDNNPVSREEIMECVNKSGKFSQRFEGFTDMPFSPAPAKNQQKIQVSEI